MCSCCTLHSPPLPSGTSGSVGKGWFGSHSRDVIRATIINEEQTDTVFLVAEARVRRGVNMRPDREG